jgi:hypothetical protein
MRLAESPAVTAAVITGKNSRHRLTRPAFDPEVGMAGFGSIFSPEPGVEMAGLGSPTEADPGVEMAGFNPWTYPATVSRLKDSSRAILRW